MSPAGMCATLRFGALMALLAGGGLVPVLAQGARPSLPASPDRFGYVILDQDDPECGFDFLDIGASGEAIGFTASGSDPADDDGGVVVALQAAFELYGEPVTNLVVSSNGYLAAASTLVAEDGGDFSNDARLPAIPDNAAGVTARLMAYHDDLSGYLSGGSAYGGYFSPCPRPSEALGDEACTVFQWTAWAYPSGGDPFDLQVVLYHRSFEIVHQIRPGATPRSGGTIGIQGARTVHAAQYGDRSLALSSDTAVCFFEPRFPPGGPVADLEISVIDKVEQVVPGVVLTYAVAAINHGPSPVEGAALNDPIPASLVDCAWTCESSAGSACTAAGSGDIDDLVSIEAGGWVDYLLSCEVAAASGSVVNSATLTAPDGVVDPDPENNSAADTDTIVSTGNLPPDCSAASASPNRLWPPDHALVPIGVVGVTDPDGDPVTIAVGNVLQDEPVRSPGSGNFAPDCRDPGGNVVQVRAERDARADGRVYHIGFSATDGRGGTCSGEVLVGVPVNNEADEPIGGEPIHDSCSDSRPGRPDRSPAFRHGSSHRGG